jgi:hypothetical protein
MEDARGIMRLSPSDGLALQEQARTGEPRAVRRFMLWSVWRQIQSDRMIPAKKKPVVFRQLSDAIEIVVVTNG